MKKLATKLTPAIKAWIREKTSNDAIHYTLYNYVLSTNGNFIFSYNLSKEDTEVSEQEFLAEFGKPKPIIQYLRGNEWLDFPDQSEVRIKPTPDYSKEIEALQNKAKENGQSVTILFE